MSSPFRFVFRLLAFLGLLMSIIGVGRLFYRQSEIGDYRREGKSLTGKVLAADVSYTRDGTVGPARNTSRRLNYVNFGTMLDGKALETTLDHTEDIIDSLQPGQALEVVYLPENYWQQPNGQRGFFDDHKPVPLSYVQHSPFGTGYAYLTYAFVLGTALLLWLGWRR